MDQAEKLRSVVKLKKQNYKPDARVITVTSGKGGVGKSNVAVNLAVQMQKMGKRVLVFDADFGLANVEVMFGAIPKYNLADVIYHGKQITEIISEGPMGIGFVSGGTGVTGLGNLTDEQISYLLHCFGELDQMADVILVDTGAGIANHVLEFVLASPEDGELDAYMHDGFWQCMDTMRDKELLEKLIAENNAPWIKWN